MFRYILEIDLVLDFNYLSNRKIVLIPSRIKYIKTAAKKREKKKKFASFCY